MFNFSVENFLNSLPIVGIGMLGIFLIIGIMALLTILFQKVFKTK